jgi:predicted cobalt transporter CbtA
MLVAHGLGDIWSDVSTVFSISSDATRIAAKVVSDPAFPDLLQAIDRVAAAEAARSGGGGGGGAGGMPDPGVGLKKIVPAINAFAYTQERRWVIPTAIAAAVAVPVGVGILIGRGIFR